MDWFFKKSFIKKIIVCKLSTFRKFIPVCSQHKINLIYENDRKMIHGFHISIFELQVGYQSPFLRKTKSRHVVKRLLKSGQFSTKKHRNSLILLVFSNFFIYLILQQSYFDNFSNKWQNFVCRAKACHQS